MSGFKFKDNNQRLDIAGNIFDIDSTNPEIIQRVLDFAQNAQAKAEELSNKDDYAKALKETIQFCLDSIDSILGEGASKKIFTGRVVGLFDCLDVLNYIVREVKTNRDEKFKAYTPNRAQRRAK